MPFVKRDDVDAAYKYTVVPDFCRLPKIQQQNRDRLLKSLYKTSGESTATYPIIGKIWRQHHLLQSICSKKKSLDLHV